MLDSFGALGDGKVENSQVIKSLNYINYKEIILFFLFFKSTSQVNSINTIDVFRLIYLYFN